MLLNKYLYLTLGLAILSSCASWQPNYKFCSETNWEKQGISDGKKDRVSEERFGHYQNKCLHFDEPENKPNFVTYRYGHFLGIKTYCTFDQGLKNGRKQMDNTNNCSNDKHGDYFRGLAKGIAEYCTHSNGLLTGQKGQITSKVCQRQSHLHFYQGIQVGLKGYCSFESGKTNGINEVTYTNNCSGKAEQEFLRGHIIGRSQTKIHQMERTINDLQVQNASNKQRITYLEQEIESKDEQIEKLVEQISKH